jgi:hypothetical protein
MERYRKSAMCYTRLQILLCSRGKRECGHGIAHVNKLMDILRMNDSNRAEESMTSFASVARLRVWGLLGPARNFRLRRWLLPLLQPGVAAAGVEHFGGRRVCSVSIRPWLVQINNICWA